MHHPRHLPLVAIIAITTSLVSCSRDQNVTAPPETVSTARMIPFYPADESQLVLSMSATVDHQALAAELGLRVTDVIELDGNKVVLFDDPGEPYDGDAINGNPAVLAWSTNYETSLFATGQTLIVGFYEGDWSRYTGEEQDAMALLGLDPVHDLTTGAGITIGFLDTGADLLHQQIRNNAIWLPEVHGLSQWESPGPGPAYGHGTAVAGAAILVAPDAQLLSIRVLDENGTGSVFQLYRGMVAALKEDVDIINLSLSLSEEDPIFEDYLAIARDREIPVVCAAGNYGNDDPKYPATSELTVGVAAVQISDRLAEFSGIGENIELAAPGVLVYSSYPSYGHAVLTGTSIATPMVSGCLALLQAYGETPADAVDQLIATSATVYLPEPGETVEGLGRVRPLAALSGIGSP